MHPMIHRMFVIAGTLLALAPARSKGQELETPAEGSKTLGLFISGAKDGENAGKIPDWIRRKLDEGAAEFFQQRQYDSATVGAFVVRGASIKPPPTESVRLSQMIATGEGDRRTLLAQRSQAFAKEGHHRRAIADLNEVIDVWPTSPWLYYYRGISRAKLRDFSGAVADLNESLHRASTLKDRCGIRMVRGRYLAEGGDLEAARDDLEQAIYLDPDFIHAHHELAKVLHTLGEDDAALAEADRIVVAAPDLVEYRVLRARIHRSRGDLDAARVDLDVCLNIDPDNASASYWLGRIDRAQGRSEEAIAHFDVALKAEPRHYPALTERGLARLAGGDLDGARRDLDAAIRKQSLLCFFVGREYSLTSDGFQDAFFDRPFLDFLSARADRPGLRLCFTLRRGAAARVPQWTRTWFELSLVTIDPEGSRRPRLKLAAVAIGWRDRPLLSKAFLGLGDADQALGDLGAARRHYRLAALRAVDDDDRAEAEQRLASLPMPAVEAIAGGEGDGRRSE